MSSVLYTRGRRTSQRYQDVVGHRVSPGRESVQRQWELIKTDEKNEVRHRGQGKGKSQGLTVAQQGQHQNEQRVVSHPPWFLPVFCSTPSLGATELLIWSLEKNELKDP